MTLALKPEQPRTPPAKADHLRLRHIRTEIARLRREEKALVSRMGTTPEPEHFRRLLTASADIFGIQREEILGESKEWRFTVPRQVVMLLLKRSGLTLKDVGQLVGNRGHDTVIAGIRTITNLSSQVPELAAKITKLEAIIK